MATITVTSKTYNSFTVKFSGFAANYSPPSGYESSQRKVYWYWKYKGATDTYTSYTYKGTSSLPNNSTTTEISFTFSSMAPGVTYDFFAKVEHPGNETYWFFPLTGSSNGYSGSSTGYTPGNYTETKTSAPSSGTLISNFTYQTWNLMVEAVNSILVSKNRSWNYTSYGQSNYLSKDSTKMTSSDKTLTAERFNSLWYNIWTWSSSSYLDEEAPAVQGEPVLASYFTALGNAISVLPGSSNFPS